MKKFDRFKKMHWFLKLFTIFFVLGLFFTICIILNNILPTEVIKDKEIRGLIFENQIWQGDVWIAGDLIALPTTTITITPGTRVFIARQNDKNNFDFLPWHLKNGVNVGLADHGVLRGEPFWDEGQKVQVRLWNVIAKGNSQNPIVISSDSPFGSPFDINLIRIQLGNFENVSVSNYRRLEIGPDVLIKNSSFKNTGECAICISRGMPSIEGNSFEQSQRFYINVNLASPFINENKFLSSDGDGIFYAGINQSEIKIKKNIFNMPNKKAIVVNVGNIGGSIEQNLFNTGDLEIPCNGKINFISNNIKSRIIFKSSESCKGEYPIGANFWDTTDINLVRATKFIGLTKDFKVNVPFILEKSPLEVK